MRWITDGDLATFANHVMPVLLTDPVVNNVAYTLVRYRLAGSVPTEPDALWLRCSDQGATCAFALQTPPHSLLLTDMPDGVVDALADHLTGASQRLPGANGPEHATDRFAARYGGATAGRIGSSRMFRLDHVIPPPRTRGRLREAAAPDRDALVAWSAAFLAEAAPNEPREDPAGPVDLRLGKPGQLWVWDVNGEIVSTAYVGGPAAGVVRVSGVYTPKDHRGRGYATACVAGLSQAVLDAGATACMLYTDLANPTSNKIYQAIGYRPVGDVSSWRFA